MRRGAALLAALAAAPAAAQVACNDVLGPGGSFELEADLVCSGTPLTLVGPVRLDMRGHRIQCLSSSHGIVVQGRRARVENGEVINCVDGLRVEGDGQHRVTGLVVKDARGDGVDIRSPANRFEEVAVVDADNAGFRANQGGQRLERCSTLGSGGDGYLLEGDKNRISDSVSLLDERGFIVVGSSNRLEDLSVASGDVGILVEGTGNRVSDSVTMATTGVAGIVSQGERNLLQGNHALGSAVDGFFVSGLDSRLKGNRATANESSGITIDGDGNRVEANQALGNKGFGIGLVDGADSNRVRSNRGIGNDVRDADDSLADCGSNDWSRNVFGSVDPPCVE